MSLTGKFVSLAHHFILLQFFHLDLSLVLIGRDGGLSTLCHSCGFPCKKMVQKFFLEPGYLHFNYEVV